MNRDLEFNARWAIIWVLFAISIGHWMVSANHTSAAIMGAVWLGSTLLAGRHAGKVIAAFKDHTP